jgi:hypothetical protein
MLQWSLVWYSFRRDITPADAVPDPEDWVEGLTAILPAGLG